MTACRIANSQHSADTSMSFSCRIPKAAAAGQTGVVFQSNFDPGLTHINRADEPSADYPASLFSAILRIEKSAEPKDRRAWAFCSASAEMRHSISYDWQARLPVESSNESIEETSSMFHLLKRIVTPSKTEPVSDTRLMALH